MWYLPKYLRMRGNWPLPSPGAAERPEEPAARAAPTARNTARAVLASTPRKEAAPVTPRVLTLSRRGPMWGTPRAVSAEHSFLAKARTGPMATWCAVCNTHRDQHD